MKDSNYPLVIRNKVPLVQRGFILLWCVMLVAMTIGALDDRPPHADRMGRWILLLFGVVGSWMLWWSFRVEVGVLRILAPLNLEVTRGPAFQRRAHRLGRAILAIEDTEDSDGDPYFKLTIEAPGGPLVIGEAHRRPALEDLRSRIERAASGRG